MKRLCRARFNSLRGKGEPMQETIVIDLSALEAEAESYISGNSSN